MGFANPGVARWLEKNGAALVRVGGALMLCLGVDREDCAAALEELARKMRSARFRAADVERARTLLGEMSAAEAAKAVEGELQKLARPARQRGRDAERV